MKIAINLKTGLFFDGTGFNANCVQAARYLSDATESRDFRHSWANLDSIIILSIDPGDAYKLNDPHNKITKSLRKK